MSGLIEADHPKKDTSRDRNDPGSLLSSYRLRFIEMRRKAAVKLPSGASKARRANKQVHTSIPDRLESGFNPLYNRAGL